MDLLPNKQITDFMFMDTETVPSHKSYDELDENMKDLWRRKMKSDKDPAEQYLELGALYPEFNRIVCTTLGYFKMMADVMMFRLVSCVGDERGLLVEANRLMNMAKQKGRVICGHNLFGFDRPLVIKRSIYHGLSECPFYDFHSKKPWEHTDLDTKELWRFGGHGDTHNIPLAVLAAHLGLPSPKEEMCGTDVGPTYYDTLIPIETRLGKIATYCEGDVVTLGRILWKIKGMPGEFPQINISPLQTF